MKNNMTMPMVTPPDSDQTRAVTEVTDDEIDLAIGSIDWSLKKQKMTLNVTHVFLEKLRPEIVRAKEEYALPWSMIALALNEKFGTAITGGAIRSYYTTHIAPKKTAEEPTTQEPPPPQSEPEVLTFGQPETYQ